MSDTEEVVYNLESVGSRRVIHGRNISYHRVLGCRVIFEEGDDRENARWRNVDCELVFPDGELLDEFRHAGEKILTVGVKAGSFFLVFVCWIYDRGMELSASCRNSSVH